MQYVLFVVWYLPSPVPSLLLNPFSPLSFCLYLTGKCLLSLLLCLHSLTFLFRLQNNPHLSFCADKQNEFFFSPASNSSTQTGQKGSFALERGLWDVAGCVDVCPSFHLPSSGILAPAEEWAAELCSERARSMGRDPQTQPGMGEISPAERWWL